jgi:ubiquitin-conjugating enzyme E2 G1
MEASKSPAAITLQRQYRAMQSEDAINGISVGLVDDNVFEWQIMLVLEEDIKYYGGEFWTWALR